MVLFSFFFLLLLWWGALLAALCGFFVVEVGKQTAAFTAAASVSCQASSGNAEDEGRHRPQQSLSDGSKK